MTLAELCEKWEARRTEHARLDSHVSAERLIDDLLADLEQLRHANALDAVTLREASVMSGYSVDHLQRMVSAGQLENIGRKGRPRIRRGDLPLKPGHRLPSAEPVSQFAGRRRIVASVTTGNEAS